MTSPCGIIIVIQSRSMGSRIQHGDGWGELILKHKFFSSFITPIWILHLLNQRLHNWSNALILRNKRCKGRVYMPELIIKHSNRHVSRLRWERSIIALNIIEGNKDTHSWNKKGYSIALSPINKRFKEGVLVSELIIKHLNQQTPLSKQMRMIYYTLIKLIGNIRQL